MPAVSSLAWRDIPPTQRLESALRNEASRPQFNAGVAAGSVARAFCEVGMAHRAAVLAGAALAHQVDGTDGTAPVFRDTTRMVELLKEEFPAQYARGLALPAHELLHLVEEWVSDLTAGHSAD